MVSHRLAIGLLVCWLVAGEGSATAQAPLHIDTTRWDLGDAATEVRDYLGRRALFVQEGTVFLRDALMQDGVIEVDIAPTTAFVFAGVVFRAESADALEEVYLRMNKSGLPDALQYTPRFNGVAGWQLYSGEGFNARAVFPQDEWIRLRVEVEGRAATVYVGDAAEPAFVASLQRDPHVGRVGLWGRFGAYFSNFSYRAAEPVAVPPTKAPAPPEGVVPTWEVSRVFSADAVDAEQYPEDAELGWEQLAGRSDGLVDVSHLRRLADAGGGEGLVYLRARVTSDRAQRKKLSLGYSDAVHVFVNGRLLFAGNSRWRARDPLFLGTVGLHDHLYIDLQEGPNEIVLALTEWFGGWGAMARFEAPSGLTIGGRPGE